MRCTASLSFGADGAATAVIADDSIIAQARSTQTPLRRGGAAEIAWILIGRDAATWTGAASREPVSGTPWPNKEVARSDLSAPSAAVGARIQSVISSDVDAGGG